MKKVPGCLLLPFLFLLFACRSVSNESLSASLTGNWLIVYPDHQLTSLHQREVYAKYQDSVVRLYGLKLITLGKDGSFKEMDSLQKPPGKWMLTADSLLKIREAGKGFNPFNTSLSALSGDELLLQQDLVLDDEKIRLVWHLKRLKSKEDIANLCSEERNAWRKKLPAPQAPEALKKRMASMLNYYGNYFALVGKEASYFTPARVPLPFHYYQHAIGLKAEMQPAFLNLFYDEKEAASAHDLLSQGITALQGRFQRSDNFVVEYGLFLKQLAGWLSGGKPA